jgi:hypothetical protein
MSPRSPEEAEDWERHGYADMKPRTELHLKLLAAWCNVPVEKLPMHPTFRTYPNSHAEAAWARVAEAALAHFRAMEDHDERS